MREALEQTKKYDFWGDGCGRVDKIAASKIKELGFESSHWKL